MGDERFELDDGQAGRQFEESYFGSYEDVVKSFLAGVRNMQELREALRETAQLLFCIDEPLSIVISLLVLAGEILSSFSVFIFFRRISVVVLFLSAGLSYFRRIVDLFRRTSSWLTAGFDICQGLAGIGVFKDAEQDPRIDVHDPVISPLAFKQRSGCTARGIFENLSGY